MRVPIMFTGFVQTGPTGQSTTNANRFRQAARQRRWRGRPRVVEERLFRDALVRERKRSDRFDQAFTLLTIGFESEGYAGGVSWAAVVEAVAAVMRDTEILGWCVHEASLGLIVPEIDDSDSAFVREIGSRVQGELERRLDAVGRSPFQIRVHRYGGVKTTAPEEASPVFERLDGAVRRRIRTASKRALDITGSLSLLILLAPLLLVIAALVKLKSQGPVFFKQPRIGQFGKPFKMLKFRTMYVNADHGIHKTFVSQLIKGAAVAAAAGDAPFKIQNDPRVTPIGRFLRKSSLDELPQLWNVLRGEMSLVGPRPPLAYEVDEYKRWHYRRVLEAKPGITGLWQVSGRSRTTFDEMVRLDLRYAKNCSAWTDIKILLATPRAVISGKGAV